ncbi:MAG: proteinase inhibitor [Myxococcales bacterium]|nr:proteinase inhibitor [Myxococcales bacterium]MCB9749729.1 proteinase inhibitor [Myxococcales bacterium]
MNSTSSRRSSKFVAPAPGLLGLLGLLTLTSCGLEDISNIPEVVQGRCIYVNRFSDMEECREYLGEAWEEGSAGEDCQDAEGEFSWGVACEYASTLGRCIMNANDPDVYAIQMPGDDEGDCASAKRGCQFFGGGVFDPSPVCGGDPEDPGILSEDAFQPGELVCMPPLDDEPGLSERGEVCTRESIHSCTEPGRKFVDYASCEPVYTQRPYGPANPATDVFDPEDPRLEDEDYMAELAWVKEQVEACACVCCHSSELAPDGPSNWYIEASPLWVDTFYPTGLAMNAGWIDSSSFGAYPPEENNGFSREVGTPSTDEARMVAFFENELYRLGYAPEDFAGDPPFGGPLHSQREYEPGPCVNGEGVSADGVITWEGSPARHLYVLEAGAENPTVPPNLDLPEGTLWNITVPWTGDPIKSGVRYGDVPPGWTQRMPASGEAPPALVPGRTYYLYVLADYIIPSTRCLFTAK